MAHKVRKLRKEVTNEKLALLFASAQLAADAKTFSHLLDSKYTDYTAASRALMAIEGTRRIVSDALKGKRAVA